MRVARVLTNQTCNQNCGFCNTRRPTERPDFVAAASVRARISNALAAGAETLVLTGGEPTMRRDLPELVGWARSSGAAKVRLETNGTLIDEDRARSLAAAGLDVALLNIPAWSTDLERINRDPGSFERLLAGAHALAAAGIRLEVSIPIVRDNVSLVAQLPQQLKESGLAISSILVSVPNLAPDDAQLLEPREAALAIQDLEAAARRVNLPMGLGQDAFLAPCFFDRPARIAHLYTLTPGGASRPHHRRLPACETCQVQDRCPGIPESTLARDPQLEVRPIEQDRVRRRLSVISSVQEQIRRELYQDDMYRLDDGQIVPARIVRVNFRCNQACHFCFVSTHLPTAEHEAIESAILEISRQRGVLVLSGGEPTLNAGLEDFIRLGKREGALEIELQTNAIQLADAVLAETLAEAGVDTAFISLHGSRPEISDAVTDAPGTFEKSVVGIDNWVATGRRARINFVLCEANHRDFPDYVDMFAARWPSAEMVLSFVAPSTDMVPRSQALIPRYADVLPFVAEGLRRARGHGLEVRGFESMCGIPLCLVPSDVQDFFELAEIPKDFDKGEFVKAAACESCALEGRCFGVRRGYAQMYGTDEFLPVAARDTGSRRES